MSKNTGFPSIWIFVTKIIENSLVISDNEIMIHSSDQRGLKHNTAFRRTTHMTTATAKKITVATVKSFIKKNRAALLVQTKTCFDGMEDGVRECKSREFYPAKCREYYCNNTFKYVPVPPDNADSMGIVGVWFTGRDKCRAFETETHRGFEVYNSCGNWIVAVAK